MSSRPQDWLRIYETKKTIYALMHNPICVQELSEKTGIDAATIRNSITEFMRYDEVKKLPKQMYANYRRFYYIATKEAYIEKAPDYVTRFLTDRPVKVIAPSNLRRIVFDDTTKEGKELCRKLHITHRERRARSKTDVSGATLSWI